MSSIANWDYPQQLIFLRTLKALETIKRWVFATLSGTSWEFRGGSRNIPESRDTLRLFNIAMV
jgi:hypothetical protein